MGCDSTITLDLTVNYSTTSSITESVMDIYTAPSGATYTTSGIYTDVVLNSVGCDSTITIDLTVNYIGMIELEKFDLVLYPNPSTGILNIQGIENLKGDYTITITSMSGAVVEQFDEINGQINVTGLVKGVYFVNIIGNEGVETLKFVKE